jgi:chorismate mutase/prephenate dehydrogenase
MFGPDTRLLSGRHVIFCNVGNTQAMTEARALFAATMAEQIDMGLDEHDRLIAYVLGLSHALNLAFFTALAESGELVPRLGRMSSTTFDAQLAVAILVAHDTPHLYVEIQARNEYGHTSREALRAAAEKIQALVAAGDESGFVRLMESGRQYLARK